jgi:putative membrane protein
MIIFHGTFETVTIWSWYPDPVVVFGVILASWLYLKLDGSWRERISGSEPIERNRKIAFFTGIGAVVVALLSPVGVLADDFLLSVHMIQHVLLTIVVPPLLIYSVPPWAWAALASRFPRAWRIWRIITMPILAFVIFHLPYSVWHVPLLYDEILISEPMHIVAHQLFIATSFVAWWPLVAPGRAYGQITPPMQMIYLFLQTLPGQIVGAFITLSDKPLYHQYTEAPRVWGLSIMADQQIGGLVMWVGMGTFYLVAMAVVFFRWAGSEDREERQRYATIQARSHAVEP